MPKKGRQATRTTPGFTGPFKGNAQQGTLFDVRTLPKTGEEIGPRGYSLNRSRQFQEVIGEPGKEPYTGKVPVGGGEPPQAPVRLKVKLGDRDLGPGEVAQGTSEERGIGPAVEPETHPFGPAHLGEIHNRPVSMGEFSRREEAHPGYFSPTAERNKSMRRARSKMIDTLARSTVDPEHLKGLEQIQIHPQHKERAGAYFQPGSEGDRAQIHLHQTESSNETLRGKQWDPEEDAPTGTKQPQQRGPVDPDAELTLLHEVGHHVSQTAGRAAYRTPAQQGREEGFADAYMMSKFRDDPRTVRWRGRTDPREHSYLARGHLDKFGGESGPGSGPSQYRAELGAENRPRPDRTLQVGNWGRPSGWAPGAETERRERPMLDEPLPEGERPFTQHLEGWSSRGAEPEEQRGGIYAKAAQITNRRLGIYQATRAELKRRWGVNRNLGSQWGEK